MLSYIRDRFLRQRIERDEKEIKIGFIVTASFVAFLLANVIYLNFLVLNNNTSEPQEAARTVETPDPTILPSPTPSVNEPLIQVHTQTQAQSSQKDYYFNLGSGPNQSVDWADVPGAISTFDIAQYSNIKDVYLESNINVPTANGTVSIRLFNKTDNYAVWNSERTVNSQVKGDLVVSPKIIYDKGPKLYQVQMKTQLGVPANLVQSRIHIITY